MAEDIKELIEKIHQEGIKAAQERGKEIEQEALKKARLIVERAQKDAAKLIEDAKDKNQKLKESTESDLKQAGRDFILSLKKEIYSMLEVFVKARVQDALKPNELAKIIESLIKSYDKSKTDVVISLKKEDLDALEKGLVAGLEDKIRKGITLKSSEDISGGFIISYDGGKSHFDFTDVSLAEYIVSYLKPAFSKILITK